LRNKQFVARSLREIREMNV